MAYDQSHESAVIGRIVPGSPKAAIRAAGSSIDRRRAALEVTCIEGMATGVCHGWIRLGVPNGPTLSKRRFQLKADRTKTIVLPIGRKVRGIISARGNHRLVAVTEINGGRTARRSLAIAPG
jgi:hypothetical protein